MARNWTPALTFVLGVTLTIGVYESLRLVRNTSKALTLASNQMSTEAGPGERPMEARRAPNRRAAAGGGGGPRAAAKNPEGRPLLSPQPRQIGARGTPGQSMPKQKAIRAGANQRATASEKRQMMMDRLESMTEEEREAWRAKRDARKQRQRDRLDAFRARREAAQAEREEPLPIEEELPPEVVDTGVQ